MKLTSHSKLKFVAVAAVMLLTTDLAQAHCDTMSGPLIPEAQQALEKGDVTPILKWITKSDEAEIKSAFSQAVTVRTKGAEAKQLADRYFLETLVRIHRAGEGAPYSGLKNEPIDPIVALADHALADGSAEDMIGKLNAHMAQAVEEKFHRAVEAHKHKDKSVKAGREYVEAYVAYMHYIEGLHAAILSEGGHEHGGEAAHVEHTN